MTFRYAAAGAFDQLCIKSTCFNSLEKHAASKYPRTSDASIVLSPIASLSLRQIVAVFAFRFGPLLLCARIFRPTQKHRPNWEHEPLISCTCIVSHGISPIDCTFQPKKIHEFEYIHYDLNTFLRKVNICAFFASIHTNEESLLIVCVVWVGRTKWNEIADWQCGGSSTGDWHRERMSRIC